MKERITPDPVQMTKKDLFVFGSNEGGFHGSGAALDALRSYGATYGVGFGLQGNSFAIPTKDWRVQTLPLGTIQFYIRCFQRAIWAGYLDKFDKIYVTKIGCGLAGYEPTDIAPFFSGLLAEEQVYLPQEFLDILNKDK